MEANFKILNLIDCPQHVPVIAGWMWDEWERSRGWTMEQAIHQSEGWCQRDAIPWGIVAEREGLPIGSMCLDKQDLPDRPDLSPWMACQYVVKDFRGRGVAKALSMALEKRARQLGFKRLYMWTEHKTTLYMRYGYITQFPAHWYGRTVVVMAKELK